MKTFGPGTVANRGDRPAWDSRAHFFGSVARAMSQFVIDWRRASRRRKRGGGERPVSFDDSLRTAEPVRGAPAELDEFFVDAAPAVVAALANLQTRAPEIADVVWLRCVAGLSLEDTAVVLGIRPRTVSKRWNLGRALLRRDLARLDPSDGDARDAAPR
jgi:DNA-directed RNA polymerase specialized sigma24 family protein